MRCAAHRRDGPFFLRQLKQAVAKGDFYENHVYALDAATGEVIWQTQVGFPVEFVVLSEKLGMVYSASLGEEVCALDMETGEAVWKYSARGLFFGLLLVDDVLYIHRKPPREEEHTDALDAKTGELLDNTLPPLEKEPARFGGLIFYEEEEDGFLIAEDAETGEVRWELKEEVSGGIEVVDGVVYVGSFNGTLYVLEPETGEFLREYRGEESYVSSFTVFEDIVYVSYGWTFIYAFWLGS